MQGTIVLQSSRMGKAFAPCQHRHEKSRKGGSGVDLVGGPPADRHVLPNLFHEPDLPQIGDKDRHTAQRRYGTLRLAKNQPLIRQQRLDLARDCIVRCFWFHPSVFSDSYLNWKTELRHSGLSASAQFQSCSSGIWAKRKMRLRERGIKFQRLCCCGLCLPEGLFRVIAAP